MAEDVTISIKDLKESIEALGSKFLVSFDPAGESKLEVENNVETTSKTGQKKPKERPKSNKRTTKEQQPAPPNAGSGAVPQGGAVARFSRLMHPKRLRDVGAIQTLLEEATAVKITIKEFGKLTIVVTKWHEVYSDKKNIISFYFEGVVQEAEWEGAPSIVVRLDEMIKEHKEKLVAEVLKISEIAKRKNISLETLAPDAAALNKLVEENKITPDQAVRALLGEEVFLSKEFDYLLSSLDIVFDTIKVVFRTTARIRATLDRASAIRTTLKTIVEKPLVFAGVVERLVDDFVDIANPLNLLKMFEAYINDRGTTVREKGFATMGNLLRDKVELGVQVAVFLNQVKLVMDLTKLKKGGFESRQEFEALGQSILERFENIGDDDDVAAENQTVVLHFVNQYETVLPHTTINIETEQSLYKILYNLYENIDNFDKVVELNNLYNFRWLSGPLKVPL